MRIAAVAPAELIEELAPRLAEVGGVLLALKPAEPGDAGAAEGEVAAAPATAGLAAALRGFERRLQAEPADAVLVAPGCRERALAAALVAIKLGIPVAVVGGDDELLALLGDVVVADADEATARLPAWKPGASDPAAGANR